MAVKYKSFDPPEYVSIQWFVLLSDLRYLDHVSFHVNEGHRTRARQQQLIDSQGLYNSVTNPHGAAPVSGNAPHIRDGRFDHAIDFNNADGVINAANHRGVTLTKTVSTESWHVEANAAQLQAYYHHNHERVLRRTLKFGSWGKDVHYLQYQLKQLGLLKARKIQKLFGPKTRQAVKKFQHNHHLTADGIVGSATYDRIHKAFINKKGH